MDPNKFTRRSQEALGAAIELATSAGNPAVEPVHLLSALLDQPDGIAGALLRAVGAESATVAERAADLRLKLPAAAGSTVSSPSYARATILTLTAAEQQAKALGDEYVSTEHLLVALASVDNPVKDLLVELGASEAALQGAFESVRGSARVTSPDPESTYQALEKYAVDLTEHARDGTLDPVIGRDSEIRRVVQVLSRRTKNNPCSSASLASARPPSWRGWPSGSLPPTSRSRYAADACCLSTWRRWSPARSTVASSRSASKLC